MQAPRLNGQVTVVTGGSSGIGRAACLALVRAGSRVVVVGKTPHRVAETVAVLAQAGGSEAVLGLTLDVCSAQDMAHMVEQTLARFGRLDALVACAGIGRARGAQRLLPYPVAQLPVAEWDEVIATNLTGVFVSNRAVLPTMMQQRRGIIINVASARGGQFGSPYAAAYCASKFGVVGFSHALAAEVSAYGIKVLTLLPDATATPLLGPADATRWGKPLAPERVGEVICDLLALPQDVLLLDPIVTALANQGQVRRRWWGAVTGCFH
ncbi:MAG: short-chain dehydrogenase [Candidatus Tectimicrobiota bacterium]|nr:MAG: short-chain dehydrogenase [Candidatus Tectomicrobia bacterium]